MSIPTKDELALLAKEEDDSDDEGFHAEYDTALEVKLHELDPEWMEAMEQYYQSSGLSRWYA
jgi:hypothetical protein